MKRNILAIFVAVLAIASAVSAATPGYPEWRGYAGDNMWTTAGNWDTNTVPTASDVKVYILGTSSAGAIINTAVTSCGVHIGYTAGTNKLVIANGGSATFTSDSELGYWGYNGTMVVESGGSVTGGIFVGGYGWGDLIVRGNADCYGIAFKNGDGFGGRADVQNGGTLKIGNVLVYKFNNVATEGAMFNVSGSGKLLINKVNGGRWDVAAARAWADAGYLTANGNPGAEGILAEQVMISGVPYTQVTVAKDPIWDNQTGGGLWTTALNWDSNVVPTTSTAAIFSDVNSLCTINADVYAKDIIMGKIAGKTSLLTVANGGYAHVDYTSLGSVTVSSVAGSGGILTIQAGGKMDVGGLLTVARVGSGKIIMNGGQLTCSNLALTGSMASSASIQLNDGSLKVYMSVGHVSPNLNIDLKKGACYIAYITGVFDLAAAQAWVNAGYFTGYGRYGNVKYEIVTLPEDGYDYVKFSANCSLIDTDGNFNSDCVVDFKDLAVLASNWLKTGN